MTFQFVERAGSPTKETVMGDVYVRCPDCGELSFDPRTDECIEEAP